MLYFEQYRDKQEAEGVWKSYGLPLDITRESHPQLYGIYERNRDSIALDVDIDARFGKPIHVAPCRREFQREDCGDGLFEEVEVDRTLGAMDNHQTDSGILPVFED